MENHTSPQEAGEVFRRARPKLAVYTHLALLARENASALKTEALIAQTRETYDGPLEVGEDLMAFEIGADKVTVHRQISAR